jgi:hypothetical protein
MGTKYVTRLHALFLDKILFGRYLGSFWPVKEPWQKKAGETSKYCKGQKMAGVTYKYYYGQKTAGQNLSLLNCR